MGKNKKTPLGSNLDHAKTMGKGGKTKEGLRG